MSESSHLILRDVGSNLILSDHREMEVPTVGYEVDESEEAVGRPPLSCHLKKTSRVFGGFWKS